MSEFNTLMQQLATNATNKEKCVPVGDVIGKMALAWCKDNGIDLEPEKAVTANPCAKCGEPPDGFDGRVETLLCTTCNPHGLPLSIHKWNAANPPPAPAYSPDEPEKLTGPDKSDLAAIARTLADHFLALRTHIGAIGDLNEEDTCACEHADESRMMAIHLADTISGLPSVDVAEVLAIANELDASSIDKTQRVTAFGFKWWALRLRAALKGNK